MKGIRRLISYIATALLVASIIKELRKPTDERTWEGCLAGFIPYDLRPPTLSRIRNTFWNPDNPHVVVPTLFGVGWTVNLYALVQYLRAVR